MSSVIRKCIITYEKDHLDVLSTYEGRLLTLRQRVSSKIAFLCVAVSSKCASTCRETERHILSLLVAVLVYGYDDTGLFQKEITPL